MLGQKSKQREIKVLLYMRLYCVRMDSVIHVVQQYIVKHANVQ